MIDTTALCNTAHGLCNRDRLDRLDLGSVEELLVMHARDRTEHQAQHLANRQIDAASRAAADVMDVVIALRLVRGKLRQLGAAA